MTPSAVLWEIQVKKTTIKVLTAAFIATPIGRMLALADEEYLYLLEFENRRGLEREIERLRSRLNARIIHGTNTLLQQLEKELAAYFSGTFAGFTIPLYLSGSAFQQAVWKLLQKKFHLEKRLPIKIWL